MYELVKIIKKQQIATLKNLSLKIVHNNNNSLVPATNVPNLCWSFSSKSAYVHKSVLNFVEIEQLFPLQEAICSYNKTKSPIFDPTELAIHCILRPEDDLISNCGQNFNKTVSFDDFVRFIVEEDIVTYEDFDCGNTFYPETPTQIRQFNRERNYISRSCEKPKCIPSNDQHNCSIIEQHSSNISLNPYNIWDMVPAALMSLNHTNDRYSMSNQYPQTTTHQTGTDSYPVSSSLRTMDSKRKGLCVRLAFFQWNYLPDGRVNETVATVEGLGDLWKPGAMDGIPPFVMNCNCI